MKIIFASNLLDASIRNHRSRRLTAKLGMSHDGAEDLTAPVSRKATRCGDRFFIGGPGTPGCPDTRSVVGPAESRRRQCLHLRQRPYACRPGRALGARP
jgi:hypothetical protein